MSWKPFFLLTLATVSQAVTPDGFEPASQTNLLISYLAAAADNGNVLDKAATQTAPTIGTQSKLEGTSFAVMMVDLDIPTANPPETRTLLHWMQIGLTQSESPETVNTTASTTTAFMFQVPESQKAFAEYIGPIPPARVPLSHRYTQILVDTSAATDDNLAALEGAAANRLGFDTLSVLNEAGLVDKVMAGNFFRVENPGPVEGSASNSSTGASGTPTGSITVPTETPVQSPIQPASAVALKSRGLLVAFFVLLGAAIAAL
ncbi:hypothetical protein SLS62_006613 [Diatrype stigma]|uniref:Phosphatidylethanolamine-binding protein n=1 Tax=Diatrype stigma TaxID=117547 RepID=A0AAN9UPA4_9PEZI